MNALSWLSSWLSGTDVMLLTELGFAVTLSLWTGLFIVHAWCSGTQHYPQGLSRRTLALIAGATLLFGATWVLCIAHLQPATWAVLRKALWPVGVVGIAVLGLLGGASWISTTPANSARDNRLPTLLGASAGAVVLMALAFILGFRFDPTAWFAVRSARAAIATPWTREIFALLLAYATFAGSLITATSSNASTYRTPSSDLLMPSAAVGATVLVTETLWLPTWLTPPHLAQSLTAGSSHMSLGARAALSAAAVWLVTAWLARRSSVHLRSPWPRAARALPRALMLVVAWLMLVSLHAARGPWSLGKALYANDLSTTYLNTSRRLPRLTSPSWTVHGSSPTERSRVGHELLTRQCGACHASRGVSSVKRLVRDWPKPKLNLFLQHQRQGDRIGHPWRRVMPPLVGSDEEIKALRSVLEPTPYPR